jgi:hypothetical protein
MREKADTDDGWFKVSDMLAQALARAGLTGNEHAICWWVLCRTYAVRHRVASGQYVAQKYTPYSARRIATDTGRDHRGITRSLYDLVGPKRAVLRINERQEIGFNTAVGTWAQGLILGTDDGWEMGTPIPVSVRPTPGRPGTPVPILGDARPQKRGRLSPPPSSGTRAPEGEIESNTPTPLARGEAGDFQKSLQLVLDVYPAASVGSVAKAERAWRRLRPDEALTAKIVKSVRDHAAGEKWKQDGGRWIPGLGKFLRNKMWTEVVQALPVKGPKCRACYVRPAAPGATVCAGCAWCVTCDEVGRESARPPAEIVVREPKRGRVLMLCRSCAGGA